MERGNLIYTGRSEAFEFEDIKGISYEAIEYNSGALIYTSARPPNHPVSRYFKSFETIENFVQSGMFNEAFSIAWSSVQLIPDVVKEFDDDCYFRSPPLDYVCEHLILTQNRRKLDELRDYIASNPPMKKWSHIMQAAAKDYDLIDQTFTLIKNNPGTIQKHLGSKLGLDGRRLAVLLRRAEERKIIRREVSGKSYKIFLA